MHASGTVRDALPATDDPRRRRSPGLPTTVLSRLGAPLLRARVARTFLSRLRGLHALPELGPNDALVIAPCRSVQTFRMARSIDVLFLDAEGVVLEARTLAPGQTAFHRRARRVVECAAGTAERLSLRAGQRLLPDEGTWA